MGPLETQWFPLLTGAGLVLAALVFFALFFVSAPYGRHARPGWGPSLNSRLAWMLMEFPSPAVFLACFLWGHGAQGGCVWALVLLWLIHYTHRAFIFPLRLHEHARRTPLLIVLFAILFNVFNGYLNGRYLGLHAADYGPAWIAGPRFLLGALGFAAGFAINLHADQVLIALRRPGETAYKIPRGGFYRWVSCPNYLGELIEWSGWALATWSLPGLSFALWTAANLIPRARAHHAWYRRQFPDYPPGRTAILPFLF